MKNYVRKCSNELLPRAYTPASVWHWARKPGHDLGQLLVATSAHQQSNFFDELIRVSPHHAGWDRLWDELLAHRFCRQYLLGRIDQVLVTALKGSPRCAKPLLERLPQDVVSGLLGLDEKDHYKVSYWVRQSLPKALPRPFSQMSLPQVAGARVPTPVEVLTCLHEAGLSFDGGWSVKTDASQKHTSLLPWPLVISMLSTLPDHEKDALPFSNESLHGFAQLLMQAGWKPPHEKEFLFASDDRVSQAQQASIDAFYAALAPALRQQRLEDALPQAGPRSTAPRM